MALTMARMERYFLFAIWLISRYNLATELIGWR